MRIVYAVMKLLPLKYRVVFISRQNDVESVDFALLREELSTIANQPEIIEICCRFRGIHDGIWKFAKATLKSMYYIATSKVCVLDAYWPAISMLRHREELKVIQMWHSLGKIKKSGYQTIGKKSGRSELLAEAMNMHANYDYIIAGGRAWNQYYIEAFNTSDSKIRNYGLPRLDSLLMRAKNAASERECFVNEHPEACDKKIVLYAPTYRKWKLDLPIFLSDNLSKEGRLFIARLHPNQECVTESDWMSKCSDPYSTYSTYDLLMICDCFITDYSSLALEAAAINKETFYYLPDNEEYQNENGVNVNLLEIMPECTFIDERALFNAITKDRYPMNALERYRNDYLPEEIGFATKQIVALIEECLQ